MLREITVFVRREKRESIKIMTGEITKQQDKHETNTWDFHLVTENE